MPFLVVASLLAQFTCGYHAVRTNRVSPWLYIIIFFPGLGCLIYFSTQMLPELLHSRVARKVSSDVTRVVDPDRELRRRIQALGIADTAENKRQLAEECLEREMYAEAAELYERALEPPLDTHPPLMMGLARARFGMDDFTGTIEVLDRLRESNPEFQSADGHLLYARALAESGQLAGAVQEYSYLVEYYPGEEARARYASLLEKTGDSVKAQELYREIVQRVDRGNKHYFRVQRLWYDAAKERLRS
ncbi:MAG: hypothetical protein WDZ84_09515 [Rhodovibrionaceae bacterium]